jgi:hypothetical protein
LGASFAVLGADFFFFFLMRKKQEDMQIDLIRWDFEAKAKTAGQT